MMRYVAFCKILEYGSFTRAAESLGYTQAAVSQMVSSLENELSLKLLIRTRSGVRLTPEGKQIYPMIQRAVSSMQELEVKAREINGLESGEIRIGIFSSIAQHVLPGLIKAFSNKYPNINFILYQGDNKTLPELLKSGIIDFAFIYPAAGVGLQTDLLATEQFLAVLPEDHPLATKKSIPLKALANEPLIIVEEGGKINTVLEAFDQLHITPSVKLRIQDDATILSMVEEGLGVSMLSAMTLEHSPYKFKKIPTVPPVGRSLSVAYENQAFLPIAAKRFINFMYEHIDEYMFGEYIHAKKPQLLKIPNQK